MIGTTVNPCWSIFAPLVRLEIWSCNPTGLAPSWSFQTKHWRPWLGWHPALTCCPTGLAPSWWFLPRTIDAPGWVGIQPWLAAPLVWHPVGDSYHELLTPLVGLASSLDLLPHWFGTQLVIPNEVLTPLVGLASSLDLQPHWFGTQLVLTKYWRPWLGWQPALTRCLNEYWIRILEIFYWKAIERKKKQDFHQRFGYTTPTDINMASFKVHFFSDSMLKHPDEAFQLLDYDSYEAITCAPGSEITKIPQMTKLTKNSDFLS